MTWPKFRRIFPWTNSGENQISRSRRRNLERAGNSKSSAFFPSWTFFSLERALSQAYVQEASLRSERPRQWASKVLLLKERNSGRVQSTIEKGASNQNGLVQILREKMSLRFSSLVFRLTLHSCPLLYTIKKLQKVNCLTFHAYVLKQVGNMKCMHVV